MAIYNKLDWQKRIEQAELAYLRDTNKKLKEEIYQQNKNLSI